MPRTLFVGSFGTRGATDRLLEAAIALVPDRACDRILYLTPSPRKLRATQLRFAQLVDRPALLAPRFHTLGPLAAEIHEQGGTRRPFPSELKPLLVRHLLKDTDPKTTLGYARAVGDFITDVKRHVPTENRDRLADTFREELAGFDEPLRRALEALTVMERYEQLLEKLDWADREDVLASATESLNRLPRPRVLILDSFVAPDRLEQRFLAAFIEHAEHTLAFAHAAGPNPASALPAAFHSFLNQVGGFEQEDVPAQPGVEPVLHAFPTIEEEVAGIARHIKRRFLDSAPELHRTVVAFPRLSRYAPLVERVFARYGLPASIYPNPRLTTSPPIVATMELLRALENDYERLATAAFLSSPWFPNLLRLPDDTDNTKPEQAAAAINLASRRAGIIKGRRNWLNIGQRLLMTDTDLDEDEQESARSLQARVRKALGLAQAILLKNDKRWTTLGQHVQALKQFLEITAFRDTILDPKQDEAERELRADKRALYDVLDALIDLDHAAGPLATTGPEFIRTLRYLVGLRTRDTAGRRESGITVVDMEETLGLEPEHLYFGGLAETDLPARYPTDPILPDRLRRKLGMPDIDHHRDWQRFHFARTLRCSPAEPFLSYHNSDGDNLILPTPFLEAAPVPVPRDPAILSPGELQQSEGERDNVPLADLTRPVDFSGRADVLQALAARFGPDKSISVTGLESYRRCPFLFYLERVMRLEAPPEPAFEIDAAQWGLLVHKVFEELYADGPVPLEQVPARARAELDRALKDAGLPAFWEQVARRVFDNVLPDFIRCEQELRDEGYLPHRTESRVSGEPEPGLRIHGRADRVDTDDQSFRVIDYKTGSTAGISGRAVTQDRTHLQLPLYARLLQDRFPDKAIDNIGVWAVRDGELVWLARRDYTVEQLVRAALDNAREIVTAIRTGRFPAADANEQTCRNCELAYLCDRRDEDRKLEG